MIERFIDLACIRACAVEQSANWKVIRQAADHDQPIDQQLADGMIRALRAAGINALPLLISDTVRAITNNLPRSTYHPAMQAIGHEFGLLSRGEINPSLYMHPLAAVMAEVAGEQPPLAASFFLPVIPTIPGGGSGGAEFLTATASHLSRFNRSMLQFLKGDESAIHDVRVSLIAIESRRPKPAYFTTMALSAAFLSALADRTLPLSPENKLLFSRIGAVVKAAMTDTPMNDNSTTSRLAYAIAQSEGEQKRVELLCNRLALHALMSTDSPLISEFPPADVFSAAFTEATDAWKYYMEKGIGKQALAQTVDMLRLISGNNADLKKLADVCKKLTTTVTKKRYEDSQGMFDHVTQFMARYLDAVETHDATVVRRVAAEEWAAAQDIEQFGSTSGTRDADLAAYIDVVREAALDVRAAQNAFGASDFKQLADHLNMVEAVLSVIGLTQASDVTKILLDHMIKHQKDSNAFPGINSAIDSLARYLDIVYLRPDDAPHLLTDVLERHLRSQQKAATVESISDKDMFDIFHEEAQEIVTNILRMTPENASLATEREARAICRDFHTLKGSAGMVGMEKLSALMADVENAFGRSIATGTPYPDELFALAREAASFALAICTAINTSGQASFDPAAVVAQLTQLRRLSQS